MGKHLHVCSTQYMYGKTRLLELLSKLPTLTAKLTLLHLGRTSSSTQLTLLKTDSPLPLFGAAFSFWEYLSRERKSPRVATTTTTSAYYPSRARTISRERAWCRGAFSISKRQSPILRVKRFSDRGEEQKKKKRSLARLHARQS